MAKVTQTQSQNRCCGQQVKGYWKGSYCRCCGEMLLVTAGVLVGCNRRDACNYCNQTTCGPHSHNGAKGSGGMSGDWPVRRYCEICGERCANTGACPEHGMSEAGQTVPKGTAAPTPETGPGRGDAIELD